MFLKTFLNYIQKETKEVFQSDRKIKVKVISDYWSSHYHHIVDADVTDVAFDKNSSTLYIHINKTNE